MDYQLDIRRARDARRRNNWKEAIEILKPHIPSADLVDAGGRGERANLYYETVCDLLRNGVAPEDVQVVMRRDAVGSWAQFREIAIGKSYDPGFGGNEISIDLKVVGAGWWLERHEYDGSEWWEFKRCPTAGASTRALKDSDVFNSDW